MADWVIFDLDGTLNRTELVSVAAHQQAQREFGLPERDDATIVSSFGGRAAETFALLAPGLDAAGLAAYTARVIEIERERLPVYGRAYDGVPAMLAALRAAGRHTAVCSNAVVRYIESVLAALHLHGLIDEIQPLERGLDKAGTLRLLMRRVHPARAVMVGDRFYDRDAARANGLPFIACLYGFAPDELAACEHRARQPLDIVRLTEEILK